MALKAENALYFGADLMEFRIDKLTQRVTPVEIGKSLDKFSPKAVFTVRPTLEGGSFTGSEIERLPLILELARMLPAYIDVELATARENPKWLKSLPKKVDKIISWHDPIGTPSISALREIAQEGLEKGTVAKVVTTAKSVDDNATTLKLCSEFPGRVVSFCMGELGVTSRVMSMFFQAPIVYSALPGEPVAPGQLSIQTMLSFRSLTPTDD